ncbi:hypothetical protein [Tsukamurella ocularis]|uniref:hypothetical protein n=1 Tax=Tsukamurella ocularis TaxID=1970234 RepID=UPI002169227A|nr:hypothetical protein [Tsukamurella ocularis]
MTDAPMSNAARLAEFEHDHGQTPPHRTEWDAELYAQVEQRLTVEAEKAGRPSPTRDEVEHAYRSAHYSKHHVAPVMEHRSWRPQPLSEAQAVEHHRLIERARADADHERAVRERWQRDREREQETGVELEW